MIGHFLKRNLPKTFLSREETRKLSDRVAQFEEATGCELVFHFRRRLGPNPTEKNRILFHKFKLNETTGHRGILITLALKDRTFAVWADSGVPKVAHGHFWDHLCQSLGQDLKKGHHLQALLNTVDLAQKLLEGLTTKNHPHFKNELDNAPLIEDDEDDS